MMIPIQWFLNKRINLKLVASCALSLALIITPAALADYVAGGDQPSAPSGLRSGAAGPRK